MKKTLCFLLTLFFCLTSIISTTSAKADVVIGDNDDIIVNENATILGRKLALMESLSDLALSGVTEFSISNTTDVDTYFDSLWSDINDAIDYLDSGEWENDLTNELASKYLTNLVQYKDYINNRGDYLAHLLPSGNPTTSLLSTFFADNIFGRHSTLQHNLSLDMFRSLSDIRGNSNPQPLPDYSFLNNTIDFHWYNSNVYTISSGKVTNDLWGNHLNPSLYSFISNQDRDDFNSNTIIPTTIGSIYILDNGININVTYDNFILQFRSGSTYGQRMTCNGAGTYLNVSAWNWSSGTGINRSLRNTFDSLSVCCNYIYDNFRHVNIYYNNEPWVLVSQPSQSNPTLDIDGLIKIFGNNQPQQYQLRPNTQIDYDQLYQVIYNAIRDNLPISHDDITYYDSHDTQYSPTIINNSYQDGDSEDDFIDSLLNYAVIPEFDTAIATPLEEPFVNGMKVMTIVKIFPEDILMVLGASFFLILFVAIIKRMIE